jgi:hypothetical protein
MEGMTTLSPEEWYDLLKRVAEGEKNPISKEEYDRMKKTSDAMSKSLFPCSQCNELEARLEKMTDALKPFAQFACVPLGSCGYVSDGKDTGMCHNCKAMKAIKEGT